MESSQTRKNILPLNYLVEDDQPNKKNQTQSFFSVAKKNFTPQTAATTQRLKRVTKKNDDELEASF